MKLSKKIFALTLAGSLTLGAVSIYGDTTKAVNVINEETDSDAVEIEVEIEVEDATDDVVVIAAPKKASALDEEAIVILEDIAVVIENTDATAEDAVVVAPENTDATAEDVVIVAPENTDATAEDVVVVAPEKADATAEDVVVVASENTDATAEDVVVVASENTDAIVIAEDAIVVAPENTIDDDVVAIINGIEIDENLYRAYLWSSQSAFEMQFGMSMDAMKDMEVEGKTIGDIAKDNALTSVALAVASIEKAEELGIVLTNEQLKEIEAQAINFMEVNGEIALRHNFDEYDVIDLLLGAELSNEIQIVIAENYMPSEEEIAAEVELAKPYYETVTARHIMFATTDEVGAPLSNDEKSNKLLLAEYVLDILEAGGKIENFVAVFSDDIGSKDNNGEYTFGRGEMIPEFEEAAFGHADGELWDKPIVTDNGYHVGQTILHNPADEELIRSQYIEYAKAIFANEEMLALAEEADVVTTATYDKLELITGAASEEAPEASIEIPEASIEIPEASIEEEIPEASIEEEIPEASEEAPEASEEIEIVFNDGVVEEGTVIGINDLLATIEGVKINESFYRAYLWSTQSDYEAQFGLSVDFMKDMEIEGQTMGDIIKEDALKSVALAIVANNEAAEMGIALDEEYVEVIKSEAANFMNVNGDIAEAQGFTEEDVVNLLVGMELLYKIQNIAALEYMPAEEEIAREVELAKPYYDIVTARHILITTTDEMGQPLSDSLQAEKLELANSLLERIKAGEDIGVLAAEFSEDPGSKNNNGEYTFGRGEMVPEFENAAFDNEDGVIWEEPVKTSYGYHIGQTIAHKPADEEQIREDYIAHAQANYANELVLKFIEEAQIEKADAFSGIEIITEAMPEVK